VVEKELCKITGSEVEFAWHNVEICVKAISHAENTIITLIYRQGPDEVNGYTIPPSLWDWQGM